MGSRAADSSRSLNVKLGRTGYYGKETELPTGWRRINTASWESRVLLPFSTADRARPRGGQGRRCNSLITIILNGRRERIDVNYFRAACASGE